MIDFDNVKIGKRYSRDVFKMFIEAQKKQKKRKLRDPKGKAEDGSYCPKKKPGQSWSYIKDNVEKDNDREYVA